jgi:hypothetical protein
MEISSMNSIYSLQRSEFTPNLTFVYLGVFSTIDLARAAACKYNNNEPLTWEDIFYDCRFMSLSKKETGDIQEPYFTIEEDWLDELRDI